MKKNLTLLLIFVISSVYVKASDYIGPMLNFIDSGEQNDRWHISALIVTPTTLVDYADDFLKLHFEELCSPIKPILIEEMMGYKFWRYDLNFNRKKEAFKARYSIDKSGKVFEISIPAAKSDPHVFFGSCNQLLDPPSTWQAINEKHSEDPYQLALLGGDQIYLDGPKGVFEVNEVSNFMRAFLTDRNMGLSADQKKQMNQKLIENVLGQYINQYSKPGFAEFLANVPCKSLADDHEYFDGKGSYAGLPLEVIDTITLTADRFYYLFQHHTVKNKYHETGLIRPIGGGYPSLSSYSFLLIFNEMAFFGLDTRSERNLTQITSLRARNFMLGQLKGLKQKNIFIIVGVPIIYQDLTPMNKVLSFIERHSWLRYLYSKIAKLPPIYDNLKLTSDCRDQWNFVNHVQERNDILTRLSELKNEKDKNITFLSGDVHCAAAGEILDKQTGETCLRQLTSSAITTDPQPPFLIFLRKFVSFFQYPLTYSGFLVQKLTGYTNLITGKTKQEIPLNNWLDLMARGKTVYPTLWTVSKGNAYPWLPLGWPKLKTLN